MQYNRDLYETPSVFIMKLRYHRGTGVVLVLKGFPDEGGIKNRRKTVSHAYNVGNMSNVMGQKLL